MPSQNEQLLNAMAVQQAGARLVLLPKLRAPDYPAVLARILAATELKRAAARLAQRYSAYDSERTHAAMVEDIEALLCVDRS